MSDPNTPNELSDDIKALIKAEAEKLAQTLKDEGLKEIKDKLDKAYGERDAAKTAAEKAEADKRAAELKALEAAGKEKEALEHRLKDQEEATKKEREAREAAEKRNLELSRDSEIKSALSIAEFKSPAAMEYAFSNIVAMLIRNEQGKWVSRAGTTIQDLAKTYIEDPNNAFLLKAKQNSGGGSQQGAPAGGTGETSLFKKTQAEVLEMVRKGQHRRA